MQCAPQQFDIQPCTLIEHSKHPLNRFIVSSFAIRIGEEERVKKGFSVKSGLWPMRIFINISLHFQTFEFENKILNENKIVGTTISLRGDGKCFFMAFNGFIQL